MILGLFVISLATFFLHEIRFRIGSPRRTYGRFRKKVGLSVGICRAAIESLAVLLGWLMGGPVGFGTLIAAFGTGVCIQITFSLLGFNSTEVKHENLRETVRFLLKSQV
jgi:Predicted membrane protein